MTGGFDASIVAASVGNPSTSRELAASSAAADESTISLLKGAVLSLMVLQNASVVICMRYSRLPRKIKDPSAPPFYFMSVVILLQEIIKIFVCCACIAANSARNGERTGEHDSFIWPVIAAVRHIQDHTTASTMLYLAFPSVTYLLTNAFVYVAIQNLKASTFQIAYQLKLVIGAVLTSFAFDRPLNAVQWAAIAFLFVGVCTVSAQTSSSSNAAVGDPVVGLAAVAAGSFCSALASVYMEAVMKGTELRLFRWRKKPFAVGNQPPTAKLVGTDLWTRNLQLSAWGVVFALITAYKKDRQQIQKYGPFHGFSAIVWAVVILQSSGGIIVSATLAYADSVLKGFATSVSLIFISAADALLFHEKLGFNFYFGAFLVLASVWAYSKPIDSTILR